MNRAEVKSKFDQIVHFSGLEQFIDTPVKRYSSGMYVRLAFAVAAHLDPDILIVDEVLAVGDAQFQKKCLSRMGTVSSEGRTVLFVSHNMGAVRNLCTRAIQLEGGRLIRDGETTTVTEAYLRGAVGTESADSIDRAVRALPPQQGFRLDRIQVEQDGRWTLSLLKNLPTRIEFSYTLTQPIKRFPLLFDLMDDDQSILFRSRPDDSEESSWPSEPGDYVSVAWIPADLLSARNYELRVTILAMSWPSPSDSVQRLSIPIRAWTAGDPEQIHRPGESLGKLHPIIPWETTQLSSSPSPRGD
jgi:lipopolysaccharide transport system ATP-binding protein